MTDKQLAVLEKMRADVSISAAAEIFQHFPEIAKDLREARSNFAKAYNALRNIRLYLRKHVDDIPYEHRDTLKRFCDEGGVTDTVLRSSSSDLADVAFPPEETT